MTLPNDPMRWAVDAFRDGRNERYSTYAAYLDGRQPLSFASVKFRSAFGQLFEAFAYNRCASVVDAHADRLRVTGFGADDETIAQAAQDLWDANRMDVREGQVEADQLALGDSYVIAEMHPTRGDVQLWAQDPRLVRVHYGDDAPGELDLGTKVWFDDARYCHLNLYFRDRIEKYISGNRAPAGVPASTSSFQLIEIAGEQNPVPLAVTDTVPIFHFANNGRTNAYGTSELRPIIPLQDAINKTLMDMLVAMEFAAFP
ncbi:MAG: phage portal protein, partial [Thermomicrobiales bacterium]